jgi:hypothetical protein
VKHTITVAYQLAGGKFVPVDITFRHYPNDQLEFIWATVDAQRFVVSAKFRVEIERWAARWLQEHATEAVHIARGGDGSAADDTTVDEP